MAIDANPDRWRTRNEHVAAERSSREERRTHEGLTGTAAHCRRQTVGGRLAARPPRTHHTFPVRFWHRLNSGTHCLAVGTAWAHPAVD